MSEEGQMMTYLGVEGVTYDLVDGVPVVREEVRQILSTDRAKYDALYGADDQYWMLQNNVMQLQWNTGLEEPLKQMEEWTYPYAAYRGQYDVTIREDSELGRINAAYRKLCGETQRALLLAPTEEEFDRILVDYLLQRGALGYDKLAAEETRQMNENKVKLGLE
jgi:putative aldouronate transport system substrate-binding protein